MRKGFVVLVLLLIVLGIGAGAALRERLRQPFRGFEGPEQFVQIPPGTPTRDIGRRLIAAGIIRDELAFRAALWWTGRSRALQAGEYRFDRPLPPIDVIELLGRGAVYTRRITFPEGLTISDMAAIYESRGFGAADSFIEAAKNPARIRDLDPAAVDLEGYLFPDTYALAGDAPAQRLVDMMVDRFRGTYGSVRRGTGLEPSLTTRQQVTLASLVEKETARPEERPIVAAVYRNRLGIGMGLQADPTVVYALRSAGRYNGNIRRTDLAIESPYNTYRYPGLPPGPIASPGRASLEAALVPANVRYLYFVSRNDGSHVFAETLAEHNRNVRQYQILYFRR